MQSKVEQLEDLGLVANFKSGRTSEQELCPRQLDMSNAVFSCTKWIHTNNVRASDTNTIDVISAFCPVRPLSVAMIGPTTGAARSLAILHDRSGC